MLRPLKALLLVVASLVSFNSANAAVLVYTATLTGAAEAPPNASGASGSGLFTIDDIANTLRVQVIFFGLTSGTTASHIHAATPTPGAGTAGVATTVPNFVGFPLGVTFGSYDATLDLLNPTTYNPAFVTANGGTIASAEAALLAGIAGGRSYYNVHTANFPSGEIRGFLTAVPEPATWAMMVGGFALVGGALRARRRVDALPA